MKQKLSVVLCWDDAWDALRGSSACVHDSSSLFHSVSPSSDLVHCPDDVTSVVSGISFAGTRAAQRHSL